MIALISNDDGIQSIAMQKVALALVKCGWKVFVAAPEEQQSGVGRSIPFYSKVSVRDYNLEGCVAWAIKGTPLVCVHLAITYLMQGVRPDIVISGINWGVNVGIPVIFSSGTLGAAIEGATLGIPSLALSQSLPGEDKKILQVNSGSLTDAELLKSIDCAVEHIVELSAKIAKTKDNVVHNVNFPFPTTLDTKIQNTTISNVMIGSDFPAYSSLFSYKNGEYIYDIQQDMSLNPKQGSDVQALIDGNISYSILDMKKLC